MFEELRALRGNINGLSTVEYTILLVLIVAGAITIWKDLGKDVEDRLGRAQESFHDNVK